jgi:hypothetical protein
MLYSSSPAASPASVTAETAVAAVNAIETAYAAVADVSLKGKLRRQGRVNFSLN